MIMFHGNGGNYGQRIPLAKIFYGHMRCNVAMLCYRGYGTGSRVLLNMLIWTIGTEIVKAFLQRKVRCHPLLSEIIH